ncbi:hypothetical protein V5O48_013329 [Marasmius crinis-equi]|uniref:Mso1 N-terminal domain-containing protein n=1 Tax=Marasmius crinis-equi TaxID=585013 RepID=A0ABR3F0I0_9AGAR
MKNGASGYASSFTTVDDNYEEDDHKSVERRSPREDNGAGSAGEGYGQVFWGRVATAASSLTVSVSKAWATNITTYAGEETPPGQESRLTRAMKAYHIEKARDPTDLPPWLFDEHERRPRRANPKEREIEDTAPRQRETKQTSAPRSAPPRGLRDVYDAVSTTVPIHQSGQTSTSSRGAVKGTDRLRAMREGKRGPVTGSSEEVERPRAAPQPRVGLPGGPGRARRA